jgi:ferredoxin
LKNVKRGGNMKAKVDRDVCIGSAMCVSIAPEVFELDDEGLSRVVNPDAGDEDLLRDAAENCPVQAIILEDDQDNQIYP